MLARTATIWQLAMLVWLAASGSANAVFVATYDIVPITSTTISPGQTITVQINLITQDDSLGAGFYLHEATSAGFAITGVTRSSSPFTDFTSTSGEITATNTPSPGNNVLNPRNDRDLGGFETSLTPVVAGTYNLGQFVLSSTGVAPGTYTLTLGSPLEVFVFDPDDLPNIINYPTINNDTLSITVTGAAVPEPGSLALCGMIATGWAVASRRRRQARSPKSNSHDVG